MGALVARGRGVSAATKQYGHVLPLLHALASSLPDYATFQLNQMTPHVRVKSHIDAKNLGDSYVMIFGRYQEGGRSMKRSMSGTEYPREHLTM